MKATIAAVLALLLGSTSTQTRMDENIRLTWETWWRDYGLRPGQVPYDGVAMVEAMRRSVRR